MTNRPSNDRAASGGAEDTKSREELEQALAQAKQEAGDFRDKYLRLLADQENFRKRLERVFDDRLRDAKGRFLLKFIEVGDDLERALAYADPADPLARGVRLTYDKLHRILAEEGVETMAAVGEPFDAEVHEAVEVMPGTGSQEMVDAELRKGYTYEGKLLRPAQVRVRKPVS